MLPSFIPTIDLLNTPVFWLHKVLKTHLLFLGPLLALAGFNTSAIAELDKADRAAMHQVIEQYIMDNPEVLRDALMELAARKNKLSLLRADKFEA